MTNRVKVIKGLEICTSWPCYCRDCPYKANCCLDSQEVMEDALALLKEQEARILDFDELEDWDNAVWFEEKDECDCYIALIANVGTYDATFVNVEPGNFYRLVFLSEFYKKGWRCWSALPTVKQRQAVQWDDA